MAIVRNVLIMLVAAAALILSLLLLYFLAVCVRMFFSRRVQRKGTRWRYRMMRFRVAVKKHRFINIVEFVKWVLIDLMRGKDKVKLFGIWLFTGYFGEGKTLGAVTFAKAMKKKYPQRNIKIFTNFNMRGQDGRIERWQDLLELPKNSIVIFDEIQSTFTSQKFKDFPIDLLWKITQCRKRGLMILATSPVFHRVVIQIRENTDYVVVCKNMLGLDRWFTYDFYRAPDFERFSESAIRLFTKRCFSMTLVAQDYDYRQYDTYQEVDRLDIEEQSPKKFNKKELEQVIRMLDRLEAKENNIKQVNEEIRKVVQRLKTAS